MKINAFRQTGEKLPFLFSLLSYSEKSRGISEKRKVKSEKRRVQKEKAAYATFSFCERTVKRCVNMGKNSKKYTGKLLDKLEFDGSFNCFYGISCTPII